MDGEPKQRRNPRSIWSGYSPERLQAALRLFTGILAGVDVEQLKRNIREQRSQESPGRTS